MRKIIFIALLIFIIPVCSFAGVLLTESFEDSSFSGRGWYDDTSPGTVVSGGKSGNCLQWAWTSSATTPTGMDAMRYDITTNDEMFVRFYIKFSTTWRGSQETYHPHLLMFPSDEDGTYSGLSDNYLQTYIEFVSDVGSPYEIRPHLQFQDRKRVNTGVSTPPNDLTEVTETRSSFYCNGYLSGSDVPNDSDCYSVGSGEYYSAAIWIDDTTNVAKDEWHEVETYYKMNSISGSTGQADGIVKMWVDNELIIDLDSVVLRTNSYPNITWGEVVLAPWIGDGAPVNQTIWIDELTVATSIYHYVSPSGTGTWAQSESVSTPCSWSTAMTNAAAGDIVYFRGGTYTPTGCSTWEYVAIGPSNSGTEDNPITFIAYPGETPIISPCGNGVGPAFGARDVDYIIWDGFSGTMATSGGEVWYFVYWNSDYSIIRNCLFTGANNASANSAPIRLENTSYNEISNNQILGHTGGTNTAGIWLFEVDHAEIYNNTIGNGANGIEQKTGPNIANNIY